eukprot:CAMPEP_0177389284 /NCGR_PEP_ID=MMETSP0368-20130122/52459_1 /TAXON_ID=447022 ORGANISM="Scrippsiella hangoei-like, Strain SHHI-4" /NCGR_SAMPLE_ID=MMETSP0368 /ASSEMBLY_ACC=CAM_ASM_000363 /LENGTH=116 /DNA_ID=CAMNT_0018854637 /DNA_START=143 /DNA_END=488 /DNA_ORIENTATION=+
MSQAVMPEDETPAAAARFAKLQTEVPPEPWKCKKSAKRGAHCPTFPMPPGGPHTAKGREPRSLWRPRGHRCFAPVVRGLLVVLCDMALMTIPNQGTDAVLEWLLERSSHWPMRSHA